MSGLRGTAHDRHMVRERGNELMVVKRLDEAQ